MMLLDRLDGVEGLEEGFGAQRRQRRRQAVLEALDGIGGLLGWR